MFLEDTEENQQAYAALLAQRAVDATRHEELRVALTAKKLALETQFPTEEPAPV